MKIGVYCSSIRPHLWGDLYKTLSNNDVDFNLCIAGPCPPMETLPGNVKYISTSVKPSQCWFIAANNTKGDYLLWTTDDIRYSNGALDNLSSIITKEKNTMVGSTYKPDHLYDSQYHLVTEFPWTRKDGLSQSIILDFPLLVCNLTRREDFNSIGIDKNFMGGFWDLDMTFEFVISRGGKTIVDEKSYCTDIKSLETCHLGSLSIGCCGDYPRLLDMWVEDKKIRSERKIPIDPLIYNDTVLTESQGPKLDCWK
jgi:hypothetical protein